MRDAADRIGCRVRTLKNSRYENQKIEVDQTSENAFEWSISFSVEGLTLNNEALKKIPDIIEKHVRDLYESQKKAKE